MMNGLMRIFYRFGKITTENYNQIKSSFEKSHAISTFDTYLQSQNVEVLLNMIMEAKIPIKVSLQALTKIEPLCSTETDEQLNLIANIKKQKGLYYSRIGHIDRAIDELEHGISTILLMKNPYDMAVAQLHKFVADLHVQTGQIKKAEKSLKQSQNLLLSVKDVQQKIAVSSGLASVYTQLALINIRQKNPFQARQFVGKALEEWNKVPNRLINEFDLTLRVKCMVHLSFKEFQQAVQQAQAALHILTESESAKKYMTANNYIFSTLFYLHIVSEHGTELEKKEAFEKMNGILKKFKEQKGEAKLEELMRILGFPLSKFKL